MTKLFKHWQNIAIGAILLALNVYLVSAANKLIADTTTAIQGWAVLIVGAVLYAIGTFLITNGATLPTNQIIAQVFALIIGAGLVLVSAIVAISAAFTRLNK